MESKALGCLLKCHNNILENADFVISHGRTDNCGLPEVQVKFDAFHMVLSPAENNSVGSVTAGLNDGINGLRYGQARSTMFGPVLSCPGIAKGNLQ